MARPKRINLPHCLYHVISRTNSGDIAFRDRYDKAKFLTYLWKYCELLSFRVHAWCLMDNHFHLLVESTNRPALPQFMHNLLTAYTVYFNRRHDRHGHLFQGRYKSYVVDKKSYLLAVSRYIHLNPVEGGLTDDPGKYDGSSLKYYLKKKDDEPKFLCTVETLSYFKGKRKKYAKFIRDGLDKNLKPEVVNQRYLADEAFIHRLRKRLGYSSEKGSRAAAASRKREHAIRELDDKKSEKIVSHVAEYFGIKPEHIRNRSGFRGKIGKARTVTLYLLHNNLPWSYSELVEYLGIKNKAGIYYHLKKAEESRELQETIKEIEKKKK